MLQGTRNMTRTVQSSSATGTRCLQAGGRSFRAHRAMLCGRSEYFAVMLGNPNFREGQACEPQELSLEDADPEVVATSLRWIYTDRVDADLPAEHLLLVRLPLQQGATPSTGPHSPALSAN